MDQGNGRSGKGLKWTSWASLRSVLGRTFRAVRTVDGLQWRGMMSEEHPMQNRTFKRTSKRT
jgi:hypothetical protein